MMDADTMLRWFTGVYTASGLIATALIQFIPTPQEITWHPYVIAYNTLQRLSVHRPQWKQPNGNGKQEPKP